MTTFDKREEGFEKQFAVDEELRFKANARRNRLLGQWAAAKLGLAGAEADAYAKAVVMSDFEEAGDHDVFRKIRSDFDAKGVSELDHQNPTHHGSTDGPGRAGDQSRKLIPVIIAVSDAAPVQLDLQRMSRRTMQMVSISDGAGGCRASVKPFV